MIWIQGEQGEGEAYASESDGEESMDDIDRFHENDNQNESSDESSQTGELKNTPVRSNNRGGHGYSLRSRNWVKAALFKPGNK